MATIRRHRDKWQVQVRRKGCPHLSKSFINKKDAQLWARQTELQAERRELPKDPRQLERYILRDLVVRYRDEVCPRKRGCEIETIILNAFLKHSICAKRISVLSSQDFGQYRDKRLEKVKSTTLKREFSALHNLFEVARDEWGVAIRENPLDKVRLECPNNRRERRLKDGELERIIEASKDTKNPLILPIILVALETGLRRSEILSATWDAVDIEDRCLTVSKTKNGHSRVVPLTRGAIAVLKGLMNSEGGPAHGTIFRTTPNALRLAWGRLLRRIGIDDLHFHDLRHEAISRFFELGLTVPEVALLSGHRDMRMLFRYAHAQRVTILAKLDG